MASSASESSQNLQNLVIANIAIILPQLQQHVIDAQTGNNHAFLWRGLNWSCVHILLFIQKFQLYLATNDNPTSAVWSGVLFLAKGPAYPFFISISSTILWQDHIFVVDTTERKLLWLRKIYILIGILNKISNSNRSVKWAFLEWYNSMH